jgi:hypothetical protein
MRRPFRLDWPPPRQHSSSMAPMMMPAQNCCIVSEVGGVRKLEDVRLYAILNSLDSAAHPPAVGTNLCALTEVPLILQLCAQSRLRRYFPSQSIDFLLTGHSPSPSSSFGIIPCPCPPSGRPASIFQLDNSRCSRISFPTLVGERTLHAPNAGSPFFRPILTQNRRSSNFVHMMARQEHMVNLFTSDIHWAQTGKIEACRWSEPPRYVIRDRDAAYGTAFIRRFRAIGIRDRPISARGSRRG